MSGSTESSAPWDREVFEDAAAGLFASDFTGPVALLTRMSDDDAPDETHPDLDENEDGLLDDPESLDDDDLLEDDDSDEEPDDDELDDDLDDELIDLDDEYDVDDEDDKPHPGSRFDE
jgi:hypothetical protein